MNDLYQVKKALLAIDVPGRWSGARRASKEAAIASGTTSVRLSKRTLAQLQDLACELATGRNWYRRDIPLTEVLEWLASGTLIIPDRRLTRACKRAINKKHAKVDRVDVQAKSMQSPRPPAVHANAPRGGVHAGGVRR